MSKDFFDKNILFMSHDDLCKKVAEMDNFLCGLSYYLRDLIRDAIAKDESDKYES